MEPEQERAAAAPLARDDQRLAAHPGSELRAHVEVAYVGEAACVGPWRDPVVDAERGRERDEDERDADNRPALQVHASRQGRLRRAIPAWSAAAAIALGPCR